MLIDKIRELYKKLPQQAVADWEDTNHFELSGMINGEYEHAWLILSDCLFVNGKMKYDCDSELGKQIGLVLDALVLTSKMAQALIAVDDELTRRSIAIDDECYGSLREDVAVRAVISDIRKAIESTETKE